MALKLVYSIRNKCYESVGIVYHANYLKFMERCRCRWLEYLGFNIAQLQQNGVIFVVREANLSFDMPARLFDEVTVTLDVLHVGKVKLMVEQKIYNKQQLLCTGIIKLASLGSESFMLTAMPTDLREAFQQDVLVSS